MEGKVDARDSRSMFLKMQFPICDTDGVPINRNLYDGTTILRLERGCLSDHSSGLPAYEKAGHYEHVVNNMLHCMSGPAVWDDYGRWTETWHNGMLIEINESEVINGN